MQQFTAHESEEKEKSRRSGVRVNHLFVPRISIQTLQWKEEESL